MFNLKKQAKLKGTHKKYLFNLYRSNPKKFIESLKTLLDNNSEIASGIGDYNARYGPNVNMMKSSINSMMSELRAAMDQKQFDLVNEIYARYAKQLFDQLQAVDNIMEAKVDRPFIATQAAGNADCGGFKPPKKGNKLDDGVFEECDGKRGDRDIVGNYSKKKKRNKAEIVDMLKKPSAKESQ